MPLFFTTKETRKRLTRSPPGSLKGTEPLLPRISQRKSPIRMEGTPWPDARPRQESTTNNTAIGSTVHSQGNTFGVHTPPPQHTHSLEDVRALPDPPTHANATAQDEAQDEARRASS